MIEVISAQDQARIDAILLTQTKAAAKTKLQNQIEAAIDAADDDEVDGIIQRFEDEYLAPKQDAPTTSTPSAPTSRIGKYTSVRTGAETKSVSIDQLPILKAKFGNALKPTADLKVEGSNFKMADSCEVEDIITNYVVTPRKDSKQLLISVETAKYGRLLINNLLAPNGTPSPVGRKVRLFVQHTKIGDMFYTNTSKTKTLEATSERIQVSAELIAEPVLAPQDRLELAIKTAQDTGMSVSEIANGMKLFGV